MRIGGSIDGLDQCPPHAGAAHVRIGIEVLQVAGVADLPIGAMEQLVHQADGPPVQQGDKAAIRFIRAKLDA